MTDEIRPFRIAIPHEDLEDLHQRLARTRWIAQLPGDPWSRGVPMDYLRELGDYWRTDYDWRAQESTLNTFDQYTTEIDSLDIHFVHVRSPEPDALPLLLTHGWPNSFVEFSRTIAPLADPRRHGGDPKQAFHVVVPSIPGFGFSDPPRTPEMSVRRVAECWATLMDRLGYERYGTQGGDLGAYVAPEVAVVAPDRVVGVHIDGGFGFPTEADVPGMSETERAEWDMMQQWMGGSVDPHALLRAAPQTFAAGWNDSPVGLLAWMVQKFQDFTPSDEPFERFIGRDQLLTNTSLYWFTGTAATSSWPMYDGLAADGFAWPKGQNRVPSGVYGGGSDLMRRLAGRDNTIVHWPRDNPGGHHFIAMNEPAAHVADLRTFFDKVR